MRSILVYAVAGVLAVSGSALGQVAGADAPVCNAKFAQLLVEQQVMESKSVVEPVKRIKMLLRSGDFLWKFDETVARSYFSEAWKMADDRFRDTGFETKKNNTEKKTDDKKGVVESGLIVSLPDQRMEVIKAISRRDSAWAKKLSDQMLADYDKAALDKRSSYDKTRELGDLLYLAQENAKTNPELSRYLYKQVMKYPLFNHWFFTLYGLNTANAALADTVYAETLQNYRNETPRRMLYLSAYPFVNERIFGVEKYQLGGSIPPGMQPNEGLQRQFLTIFFARIAAFAASETDINRPPDSGYQAEAIYMVSALNEIEPIIVERFPDLIQQFGVARSQANSLLSQDMRKSLDEKEKQDAGLGQGFEERLAEVQKAESEGRLTDFMIVNLLTWGTRKEEEFAKVLPWLDKIKEEKPRQETINYFWFLRTKLAIKEKRFDDAEAFVQKVPELEHRALLMFDLAEIQAKSETDVPQLFDTLNRLSKVTHSADGSVSKAQILLGLANMYEKVNHSVALDELGEAIRVTNGLKEPDIFATFVTRQIQGKNFGFYATFSTPGYDLEKTFEELSKKDFELSLANAKALDDKYFRTLAVIAVAKNCAANAPVKTPKPKATPTAQ